MEFIPGPDLPTGGLLFRFRSEKGDENVDMIKQFARAKGTLVCQRVLIYGKFQKKLSATELLTRSKKNTILNELLRIKRNL